MQNKNGVGNCVISSKLLKSQILAENERWQNDAADWNISQNIELDTEIKKWETVLFQNEPKHFTN